MRVVVVGGGYGGLAVSVRLAKLGHDVTLVEASDRLGGALTTVETEGFAWDAGPWSLQVPAVVRDLFRKSGQALERELGGDLTPLEVVREHRFADRSVLRLPSGARRQTDAFEALGPGLGDAWDAYVSPYAEVWDVLRRHYFEEPWTPAALPREVAALLDSRAHLHRRLRKAFRDDRPAMVAGHPFVAEGHDLRNVPAWAGVVTHLEQLFGAWTVPARDGGLARLRDLLVARLATRGVTVLLDTPATDLVVRGGRVAAVATASGEVAGDAVVCAVDPRRLPVLAPHVARTMPAMPPVIAHVGVEGDLDDLPHETVLHGDPMVVVRPGGRAPEGHAALTVHGRGRLAEDLLTVLARHGTDLRQRVVARVDRTPYETVQAWGGSPHGVLWQGRGTVRRRLGPTTPVPGVYAVGAHATPGSGLAYVGLGAALVATVIGPA
ncbi:NAD(P)/FAD-dependent oxidoreductase [Nocardioides sp. 1609]|uniref:phytoene desaturase family protein n=1 Tax=Nocardioides sp. 1609 TaxID=2508327 RepID=UPI00106FAA5E|nr:NAD(P)/FAD-dependent oxidoreductase [Nocardioides sp. 1609]